MAIGSKLNVWMNPGDAIRRPDAPLPTKAEVLYSEPNLDGTRKACANCALYAPSTEACAIVDADLITPSMVCGYHVEGQPTDTAQLTVKNQVPAVDAGLVEVSGGSSCDTCRWYSSRGNREGACSAVITDAGAGAVVDALGCCARWET